MVAFMPVYHYQCLYCGNCDLRLSGLNDYMTLCSQCGGLMLRLDDDFLWQFCDKNHFQFTTKTKCSLVPAFEVKPFSGKISINHNSDQCRFGLLNKWNRKVNILPWRESRLFLYCRAKIFYDKNLKTGELYSKKPNSS